MEKRDFLRSQTECEKHKPFGADAGAKDLVEGFEWLLDLHKARTRIIDENTEQAIYWFPLSSTRSSLELSR